jgi:hypothetical protein
MSAIRWGLLVAVLCASGVALGDATLVDGDRRLVLAEGSADGAHALRLQDAQGNVVRELDLAAFLPAAYVRALPRGEAGLRWYRDAKLDRGAHRVDFSVPAPGSEAGTTGPELRFSIDLRDGTVRTEQIREYLAAADQARILEAGPAVAQR